jgi:hypothetical protein
MLAKPEYILLPCVLAVIGFLFRALSRRQTDPNDLIQDAAMGPELLLSALVVAASKALQLLRLAQPPQMWGVSVGAAFFSISCAVAVGLLAIAIMIRYWGTDPLSDKLTPVVGVAIPLLTGLGSLAGIFWLSKDL